MNYLLSIIIIIIFYFEFNYSFNKKLWRGTSLYYQKGLNNKKISKLFGKFIEIYKQKKGLKQSMLFKRFSNKYKSLNIKLKICLDYWIYIIDDEYNEYEFYI
jgi:hypothetical protein